MGPTEGVMVRDIHKSIGAYRFGISFDPRGLQI